MKAGLREDEADDVVQETMRSMINSIQDFEADPAHGKFRAWLLKQRAVADLRSVSEAVAGGSGQPGSARRHGHDADSGTRARSARGGLGGLVRCGMGEPSFREQAFKELQLEVKAAQYQIFHLLVVEQK